jgi:hypothetical protein
MSTHAAAPSQKAAKPAPAAKGAPGCDCAEGSAPESESPGLPRFLARFGAAGCGVQAKLTVGRSDDPFEREADAVSDAVMRDMPVRMPGVAGGTVPAVQRLCDECVAAEADMLVQRAAEPGGAAAPPAQAEPAVDSGSPLEPAVRTRLESSLGADLGNVRVHTGPAAQGMAQSLHAKAFTHGEHIWLGPRQRVDDLPLMAHEVAHVMQQGSGRARPDAVQRAPADYQHPEDGGGVLGRMQARINAASEGHEDEQPSGDATARAHAARSAAGGVDRGELAQERGTLEPQAKPSVDRPAQEAPKVQQAAAQTEETADAPAEPLAEAPGAAADGKAAAGGKGGGKSALADGGAGQAQSAFGAAASVAMPAPPMPVTPPLPVSNPTDAGGQPLPGDAEADGQIAGLAGQAQTLREESARIRSLAAEERRNSQTLRGNLALVRGGVMQADLGISRSQDHLGFRQELLGQAREGLGVSQQKAATVAAEAPHFASKADEGKAESGPMASESSSLAAENAANTPDDEEAAANAREQGGAMNQAGSDIGTTDDAITQTQAKAGSLGQDAAQAQEKNQATQGRIDGMQATLAATGDKLGEMGQQSAQARAQMDGLASAPDSHAQQARAIDDRGEALAATSERIEARAQAAQSEYAAGMAAVPAAEPWTRERVIELYGEDALEEPAEAEAAVMDAPAPAAAAADDLLVQRTPADSGEVEAPPPPPPPEPDAAAGGADAGDGGAGAAPPPDAGPAAADAPVEAPAAEAPADPGAGGADPAADAGAGAATPPAVPAPPERERVDAAGAVTGALPSWLTGVEPPNEEARTAAAQAAAERRAAQIAELEGESGNGFASMTATDRMGWALRQTGRNLFGSVGNIQWPGWGHLALGLIDPRGPMMGVVSGLGMMLSGGANLLSAEQWRRDPLGNLLKSAADIATGLTVVLGSITALAGVIIAIMTAITILSFGTAAPVTGPVIAFCTTVLTTVGGWTIAVGKVALVLQALVFIKNLIDAACAQTAAELQSEADQMTENVSDAGNVLMQMGMAKAGQLGGRAASAEISAAGGGVRYAAQLGARAGVGGRSGLSALGRGAAATGRGLRALPAAAMRGARALPGAVARGVRSVPGAIGRGAVAAGRAVARGTVAAGRAIGRGTVAAGRAIGRGTAAAGRAVGRGVGAVARSARALPGAALRGARGLPAAVVRGVRALPGAVGRGVRGLPGGIRAAARGTREYFGSRFSRGFIVGDDIANLGMARSASAEARAAVWAEARAPGGALAGEAGTLADDVADVHPSAAPEAPAGVADDAVPAANEPPPARTGDHVDIADAAPESAAAREASVAESGTVPNERMSARQVRNEIDDLNAHPERVEGTAPHRHAEAGEHQWREDGASFCRFSPSRICVTSSEVRAGHVANAETRAAEAEADAVARARMAAEARERVAAHEPLSPADRAVLEADIAAAETRATAARDSLRSARSRLTRAEKTGSVDDIAAARQRVADLEAELAGARSDAAAGRAWLDEPKTLAREAEAAESAAATARAEATAAAEASAAQRELSRRIDALAAEDLAIRARNRGRSMMDAADHRRLREIGFESESLRNRLAAEIEAAQGLTTEARATLRAGTPFKGQGGRARQTAFYEGLPDEARGPGGTYIDYVTGEARPLSELAVDHVIPVDEIFRMDGFGRLPRADQLAILDLEANLRLLERGLNSAKQARPLSGWVAGDASLAARLGAARRATLAGTEAECRLAVQNEIARRLALMRPR